jgi:hypothetical protein
MVLFRTISYVAYVCLADKFVVCTPSDHALGGSFLGQSIWE